MIVFNKDKESRSKISKGVVLKIFKRLEKLTSEGRIDWTKQSPYETIIEKDGETWYIKIFEHDKMLHIEWINHHNQKDKRYPECSRTYRTYFDYFESGFYLLNERISTGPEIIEDLATELETF